MTGVAVKRERGRLERLRNELVYLGSHQANVGWIDPSKMHPAEDGAKQPMTMGRLARVLNYGREAGVRSDGKAYPAIPARPFMKLTFDKHLIDLKSFVNRSFGQLVKGRIDGLQLINLSSLFWKSKIQETMRDSSNFSPLSKSTVGARKRRNKTLRSKNANTPLIDTGALINSIDHEVVSI